MVFTHLSHVYSQGSSIYTTYFFRTAESYEKTLERWKKIKAKACESVSQGRSTISHQHGVGKDHAPYMIAEKGELGMKTIKAILNEFDEEKRLAPNVLIQDK